MDTSLAPGYCRVTYNGQLFPHHMVIPINFDGVPTPGVEPDLLLKDASSLGAEAAIGAFVTLVADFYNTSEHFGLAEIHAVDDVTGADTFIYAWNLNILGTSPTANKATFQTVMTFKTVAGGLYRLYMMENIEGANSHILPPYSDPTALALSNFVVGDSSPVYGRGNAYPFVPVSKITKSNDKLRKQQGLT